jgi:hypothetical protein
MRPHVGGTVLSIGVALFARIVGLDRDRAFYPTVMIVIAAYYVQFAAISGSVQTAVIESSKSPPSVLQNESPDHGSHDCQGQVTAKGKAKESDMRRYQRQHHKYGDPCVPANAVPLH